MLLTKSAITALLYFKILVEINSIITFPCHSERVLKDTGGGNQLFYKIYIYLPKQH